MTGASRRTGKRQAIRQLATIVGIKPPAALGGTVPASWLRKLLEAEFAFTPEPAMSKAELIKEAITMAGGDWNDRFLTAHGSTITGEAFAYLARLLETTRHAAEHDNSMNHQSNAPAVDIQPQVSILGVLSHLNYKPWYALSEFVDNSIESFLRNRAALSQLNGRDAPLRVTIELETGDDARIVIRDNAAGIALEDFPRAFRPATPPPPGSELSEFGMGMKSAACWFSSSWSVRTSSLGDAAARTVHFDVASIISSLQRRVPITTSDARADEHYTEIALRNLRRVPQTRTIGKIKEHLASIYRVFIRDGRLELIFDNEQLKWTSPACLVAPPAESPDAESIEWLKDIEFTLDSGLTVTGSAGVFARGQQSRAGFALFRHGRVIEGSGDEGYRPAEIFGSSNSFRYQRVFGELHLDEFTVSHTKDGIRWDEQETEFLERLSTALNADPLPILRQAENYRAKSRQADDVTDLSQPAQAAASDTTALLGSGLGDQLDNASTPPPDVPKAPDVPAIPSSPPVATAHTEEFVWRGQQWKLLIDLDQDAGVSDWIRVDLPIGTEPPNEIRASLAMNHPFTSRFVGPTGEGLQALVRMSAAIALAELVARNTGLVQYRVFRRTINQLLSDPLSRP